MRIIPIVGISGRIHKASMPQHLPDKTHSTNGWASLTVSGCDFSMIYGRKTSIPCWSQVASRQALSYRFRSFYIHLPARDHPDRVRGKLKG